MINKTEIYNTIETRAKDVFSNYNLNEKEFFKHKLEEYLKSINLTIIESKIVKYCKFKNNMTLEVIFKKSNIF